MKRQNNKKHGKKTLIVLSLLGLTFVAALFLGAVKIYAIFQEKELQEKVSVLIAQEETYHAENDWQPLCGVLLSSARWSGYGKRQGADGR